MLPLHENHVDFLSAKQSLSADIEFQSSLPVRGATAAGGGDPFRRRISIHAPRKGSDLLLRLSQRHVLDISIHAPLAESDVKVVDGVAVRFISIHAPREGSDQFFAAFCRGLDISIHAPREGSDSVSK